MRVSLIILRNSRQHTDWFVMQRLQSLLPYCARVQHIGVYLLALEKKLAGHIHLVAPSKNSAHAVLGVEVGYKRMVLSVHLNLDLEAFVGLFERLFKFTLLHLDCPYIMV